MTDKLYTTVYANGEAVSQKELKANPADWVNPTIVGNVYFHGKPPVELPPPMTPEQVNEMLRRDDD